MNTFKLIEIVYKYNNTESTLLLYMLLYSVRSQFSFCICMQKMRQLSLLKNVTFILNLNFFVLKNAVDNHFCCRRCSLQEHYACSCIAEKRRVLQSGGGKRHPQRNSKYSSDATLNRVFICNLLRKY